MNSLEYMDTPVYELAVELAEEFSEDFDTQEEFIEGFLHAISLAE